MITETLKSFLGRYTVGNLAIFAEISLKSTIIDHVFDCNYHRWGNIVTYNHFGPLLINTDYFTLMTDPFLIDLGESVMKKFSEIPKNVPKVLKIESKMA